MFTKGKSFWKLLPTIWNENMAKKKVVTEIFCRVIQSWGWYIYDLFLKKEKVHLLKKSHQRLWMLVSGSLIMIKCYGSLLFFLLAKSPNFDDCIIGSADPDLNNEERKQGRSFQVKIFLFIANMLYWLEGIWNWANNFVLEPDNYWRDQLFCRKVEMSW